MASITPSVIIGTRIMASMVVMIMVCIVLSLHVLVAAAAVAYQSALPSKPS